MAEKKYIDTTLVKAEFTGNFQYVYSVPHIRALIDSMPAADVVEVKHGKWSGKMVAYRAKSDIEENGDMHFGFKCSVCGGIFNKTAYCGGCGARMDGEENDT